MSCCKIILNCALAEKVIVIFVKLCIYLMSFVSGGLKLCSYILVFFFFKGTVLNVAWSKALPTRKATSHLPLYLIFMCKDTIL